MGTSKFNATGVTLQWISIASRAVEIILIAGVWETLDPCTNKAFIVIYTVYK